MKLDFRYVRNIVKMALEEDIGGNKDITTYSLIPPTQHITVKIMAKQTGIIAGMHVARQVFKTLDKTCVWRSKFSDGDRVKEEQTIAIITGLARAILTGERTALNFLQHLSGIATLTNKFVLKTKNRTNIFDTRKTSPGLRLMEKYAVTCGGGKNHRMTLSEMVLIKENHIHICKHMGLPISQLISSLCDKVPRGTRIEMEVQNMRQLELALNNKIDIIMLDNMSLKAMRRAIQIIRKHKKNDVEIEISGNINFRNIEKISKLGIDRVSIGAITHSAPVLDISLEIM